MSREAAIEVHRVEDLSGDRRFFQVPTELYGADPDWADALEPDLRPLLGPPPGPSGGALGPSAPASGAPGTSDSSRRDPGPLGSGESTRLLTADGRGRIAVFATGVAAERPVGTFGFLDAPTGAHARALLAAAERWLGDRGFAGMDGPGNPGERDRFSGAVTRGFGPPIYLDNHNPPELVDQLLEAGLRPYSEAVTYGLDLTEPPPEVPLPGLRVTWEHLDPDAPERFAAGMHAVYDRSFAATNRARKATVEDLGRSLRAAKGLADPRLFLLGRVDGVPAAVMASVPDYNELLSAMRRGQGRTIESVKTFVLAVAPEWRGTGLALALSARGRRDGHAAGYRRTWLSGIGGHTPAMHTLMRVVGARVHRVHVTFRRWFDGAEVKPLPMAVPWR